MLVEFLNKQVESRKTASIEKLLKKNAEFRIQNQDALYETLKAQLASLKEYADSLSASLSVGDSDPPLIAKRQRVIERLEDHQIENLVGKNSFCQGQRGVQPILTPDS